MLTKDKNHWSIKTKYLLSKSVQIIVASIVTFTEGN